jgi:hypothetical protein
MSNKLLPDLLLILSTFFLFLLDIESKYVLWFKVSSKLVNLNEDVIFGNVYIPPEGSPYFPPDTFDQIENEIRTFSQNYKYISLFGFTINKLFALQMSNKLLPDLLLILSTFFLFLSIFNSLRVAKSFCKNSVKSSSCSFISKSIKSGSSAVLLLKSPNKEMYL